MTRYTLQVQSPSLGWVVAIKSNDLNLIKQKKQNLKLQGHTVRLIKEKVYEQ